MKLARGMHTESGSGLPWWPRTGQKSLQRESEVDVDWTARAKSLQIRRGQGGYVSDEQTP